MIAILHKDGEIIHAIREAELRGDDVWQCGKYSCTPTCEVAIVPDQPLSHIVDETGGIAGTWPDGIPLKYLAKEQAQVIDMSTEESISVAVHPLAGIGEQLGILRDQTARMLNGDMTASDDFTRLNAIAIAEIEKARTEKDGL